MKIGDSFVVEHEDMLKPLVNSLVDMKVEGEDVRVRIESVSYNGTHVTVVPPSTKE